MNGSTGMNNGLINGLSNGSLRPHASPGMEFINQQYFNDINDWSTLNSPTTSVSGGKLTLSGGTNTFTKCLMNTKYGSTNTCNWSQEYIWQIGTISATTDFFGIGVYGDVSFGGRGSIWAGFLVSTTAGIRGQLNIYRGGVSIATGATKLTINTGDVVKYTFTRTGQTFTISAYNLTTGSATVSATVTIVTTVSTNAAVNTGKFAMLTYSGTAVITSCRVTSTNYNYPKIIFIGDSKTEGFDATTFANNYPNQTMLGSVSAYDIYGKVNSVTADILNVMHELIASKPKYAVLNIGRNNGMPIDATDKAEYTSIVKQLKDAGIIVIHLLPIPEISLDQSTLYCCYIRE